MDTRATLALSLVILVLLGGCSGLFGGAPESAEAFDYPDGFAADGVNDSDKALDTHTQAIVEQSSYRSDVQFRIEAAEDETVVDEQHRVDFDSEAALRRSEFETPDANGTIQVYYEDGQRVVRTVVGGQEAGVNAQEWTFSAENQTGTEAVGPLLRNDTDYETTLVERDDGQFVRFEMTSLESSADFFGVEGEDDVAEFNASFVLGAEGIVHAAEYELTVQGSDGERTVSMTFEATGFGETAVERPEWASDA
jgi:hypothetical protein